MPGDDSDSDLEIVGYVKPEVTYPHNRSDCTEYPHRVGDTKNNERYCDKCYCYVCDVLVAQCEVWGTSEPSKRKDVGKGYGHCNAYSNKPGEEIWKARRQIKQCTKFAKNMMQEFTAFRIELPKLSIQTLIKLRESYVVYIKGAKVPFGTPMPCSCKCHTNQAANPCSNCKVLHDQKKTFDYSTSVHQRMMEVLSETYGCFKRDLERKDWHQVAQSQLRVCLVALVRLEAIVYEMSQHNIRYDFLVDQTGSCNPESKKHAQPALHIHEKVDKVLNEVIRVIVHPNSHLQNNPMVRKMMAEFYGSIGTCVDMLIRTGAMLQGAKQNHSIMDNFLGCLNQKCFASMWQPIRDKIRQNVIVPRKPINGTKTVAMNGHPLRNGNVATGARPRLPGTTMRTGQPVARAVGPRGAGGPRHSRPQATQYNVSQMPRPVSPGQGQVQKIPNNVTVQKLIQQSKQRQNPQYSSRMPTPMPRHSSATSIQHSHGPAPVPPRQQYSQSPPVTTVAHYPQISQAGMPASQRYSNSTQMTRAGNPVRTAPIGTTPPPYGHHRMYSPVTSSAPVATAAVIPPSHPQIQAQQARRTASVESHHSTMSANSAGQIYNGRVPMQHPITTSNLPLNQHQKPNTPSVSSVSPSSNTPPVYLSVDQLQPGSPALSVPAASPGVPPPVPTPPQVNLLSPIAPSPQNPHSPIVVIPSSPNPSTAGSTAKPLTADDREARRKRRLASLKGEKTTMRVDNDRKLLEQVKAFDQVSSWHSSHNLNQYEDLTAKHFKLISSKFVHPDVLRHTYPWLFQYSVLANIKLGYHYTACVDLLSWTNWKRCFKDNAKLSLTTFFITILRGLLGERKFYADTIPKRRQLFIRLNMAKTQPNTKSPSTLNTPKSTDSDEAEKSRNADINSNPPNMDTDEQCVPQKFPDQSHLPSGRYVPMHTGVKRAFCQGGSDDGVYYSAVSQKQPPNHRDPIYIWEASRNQRTPIMRLYTRFYGILKHMDSYGALMLNLFMLRFLLVRDYKQFFCAWTVQELGDLLSQGKSYADWIGAQTSYKRLLDPKPHDTILSHFLDTGLVLHLLSDSLDNIRNTHSATKLGLEQIILLKEFVLSENVIEKIKLPKKISGSLAKKQLTQLQASSFDFSATNSIFMFHWLLDNFPEVLTTPLSLQFLSRFFGSATDEREHSMVLRYLEKADVGWLERLQVNILAEPGYARYSEQTRRAVSAILRPVVSDFTVNFKLKYEIFIRYMNLLAERNNIEIIEDVFYTMMKGIHDNWTHVCEEIGNQTLAKLCIDYERSIPIDHKMRVYINKLLFRLSPTVPTLFQYCYYAFLHANRVKTLWQNEFAVKSSVEPVSVKSHLRDTLTPPSTTDSNDSGNVRDKEPVDDGEGLALKQAADESKPRCGKITPSQLLDEGLKADIQESLKDSSVTCILADCEALEFALKSQHATVGTASSLVLLTHAAEDEMGSGARRMTAEQGFYSSMSTCACTQQPKRLTVPYRTTCHQVLNELHTFFRSKNDDISARQLQYTTDFCQELLLSTNFHTFFARLVTGWLKCSECGQDSTYLYTYDDTKIHPVLVSIKLFINDMLLHPGFTLLTEPEKTQFLTRILQLIFRQLPVVTLDMEASRAVWRNLHFCVQAIISGKLLEKLKTHHGELIVVKRAVVAYIGRLEQAPSDRQEVDHLRNNVMKQFARYEVKDDEGLGPDVVEEERKLEVKSAVVQPLKQSVSVEDKPMIADVAGDVLGALGLERKRDEKSDEDVVVTGTGTKVKEEPSLFDQLIGYTGLSSGQCSPRRGKKTLIEEHFNELEEPDDFLQPAAKRVRVEQPRYIAGQAVVPQAYIKLRTSPKERESAQTAMNTSSQSLNDSMDQIDPSKNTVPIVLQPKITSINVPECFRKVQSDNILRDIFLFNGDINMAVNGADDKFFESIYLAQD